MLRKLTSPKRGSRFATAGDKSTPQELGSLAAEAASPPQREPVPAEDRLAAEAKAPSRDSQDTKKTKKKTKTTESSTAPPQQPLSLALDLQAISKADGFAGDRQGDKKEAATAAGSKFPSPLVRTPRSKSIFNEEDAKPTSPTKKTAKRSKRDSLGLKSLGAKRESPVGDVTTVKDKPKNSPKKSPEATTDGDADADTRGDAVTVPALSPIRRKPRAAADSIGNQSTTTAAIRDATSLVARSSTRHGAPIPPLQQPEIHIIGEIVGGGGFGKTSDGYCCKWSVDYGNQWIHIAGDQLGQTQIDYADSSPPDEGSITWAHPLDLHFATTVFHGWPKLLLQVWRVNSHMQMNVVGYGFVHVPFTPGHHRLRVSMWRPLGTSKEELEASLMGHTPELLTDEVLFNAAWAERCRLRTIATGRVHVDLGIIVRNFHSVGLSKMDM